MEEQAAEFIGVLIDKLASDEPLTKEDRYNIVQVIAMFVMVLERMVVENHELATLVPPDKRPPRNPVAFIKLKKEKNASTSN